MAAVWAAPSPALGLRSALGAFARAVGENRHKERGTPPAAFLCATGSLSHRAEMITVMRPTLRSSFVASLLVQDLLSAGTTNSSIKSCFGVSNHTYFPKKKKKRIKVQILASGFVLSCQILRWINPRNPSELAARGGEGLGPPHHVV